MPPDAVNLREIERAGRVIAGRLHRTPMLSSRRTSERAGGEVILKAELFQRTGSFKPRGVLNKLAALTGEERSRGVVAASSGNHAQALACCAGDYGLDCLVVMAASASDQKAAAARSYGATVDQSSPTTHDAVRQAEELSRTTGRILIHAYDDVHVIAGQGTVGLELVEQVPDLDTVVVPVSGGGLIAGIAVAVKGQLPRARIVAVEPELAPTLARALEAGRPVELESGSLADGLGAPSIGALCLPLCAGLVDEVVHVSDLEIVQALQWLYESAKLACEPAGAASVAALFGARAPLRPGDRTVAVISGGNIDPVSAARLLSAAPAA
jgi:threonine dehydratase